MAAAVALALGDGRAADLGLPSQLAFQITANAFGQELEHLERKGRILRHQHLEAFGGDGRHAAFIFADGRGGARLLIDQRHFAKHAAGGYRFKDAILTIDLHLAFEDGVHDVAGLAFLKNDLARGEGAHIRFIVEDSEGDPVPLQEDGARKPEWSIL